MFSEQVTVNIATSKLRCKLAERLVAMTELKNNSLYDLMVNGLPYLLVEGERSVVLHKVRDELIMGDGDFFFEYEIDSLQRTLYETNRLMGCGYTPLSAYLNATLDNTTEEMPHPEFGAYWYPPAWKTAKLLRELGIKQYGDRIAYSCTTREEFLKCLKCFHTLPNVFRISFQEDAYNWLFCTHTHGYDCSVTFRPSARRMVAVKIEVTSEGDLQWVAHCETDSARKGDSLPCWLESCKDLLSQIEQFKG